MKDEWYKYFIISRKNVMLMKAKMLNFKKITFNLFHISLLFNPRIWEKLKNDKIMASLFWYFGAFVFSGFIISVVWCFFVSSVLPWIMLICSAIKFTYFAVLLSIFGPTDLEVGPINSPLIVMRPNFLRKTWYSGKLTEVP